jgi:predicted nucleotidyltransferase component of viral defense system
MISRDEIMEVAGQLGLRPQVVEKDYVLGWLLAGIYRDPTLSKSWVFKGGTCLKKCYFETYRFSEDLDFTLLEPAHLDKDFLAGRFTELSAWLYEETGIEIPPDKLHFEVWDTTRGSRAGEGRVSYRGPIAPNNKDLPRIKLDLTADEKLVLPKASRSVAFPYTDLPEQGISAECYAYSEIFGEKVRALSERTRPRDLYDVINLYRHDEFDVAAAVIRDVITQKCGFKGLAFPSLAALQSHKDELFADWQTMLAHQLPQLPPVESYWDALAEFFDWLTDKRTRTHLGTHPLAGQSEIVRLPVGALHVPGRNMAFMEVIRFAAANRLCVELDYTNQKGERHPRLIEPYSLRRTKDGNMLLMAVEANTGQSKSYRIDQMHGARMTDRTFVPRYQVELTPSSPMTAPPLARALTNQGFGFSASPPRVAGLPRRYSTKSASWGTKAMHVYRCPVCNKKFEHSTMSAALRKHKDKSGYQCSGRSGMYEGTVYK